MIKVFSVIIILMSPLLYGSLQPKEKHDRMQTELDIFSGRENPAWKLNDEQSKEFLARFKSLEPNESKKPFFGGLGYRGLRVTMLEGYDEVRIWNTIVETRRGDKRERWRDKDRALEKYLFRTGKDHLDSSLYDRIASEIDKSP
jgi:hypothetical protein